MFMDFGCYHSFTNVLLTRISWSSFVEMNIEDCLVLSKYLKMFVNVLVLVKMSKRSCLFRVFQGFP